MRHGATRGRAASRAAGQRAGRLAVALAVAVAAALAGAPARAQASGASAAGSTDAVVAVYDRPSLGLPELGAEPLAGAGRRLLPNLRPGLLPDVRDRLVASFGLAASQARDIATCSALFTQLGADGVDRLRRTFYYPATPEVAAQRCSRGVLAATVPGSAVTWVCPAFKALSTQRAALVLIHEALHFAGMPERPQVAGALSSAEINDLVHDACRL